MAHGTLTSQSLRWLGRVLAVQVARAAQGPRDVPTLGALLSTLPRHPSPPRLCMMYMLPCRLRRDRGGARAGPSRCARRAAPAPRARDPRAAAAAAGSGTKASSQPAAGTWVQCIQTGTRASIHFLVSMASESSACVRYTPGDPATRARAPRAARGVGALLLPRRPARPHGKGTTRRPTSAPAAGCSASHSASATTSSPG